MSKGKHGKPSRAARARSGAAAGGVSAQKLGCSVIPDPTQVRPLGTAVAERHV